jgi:hypothetical protein
VSAPITTLRAKLEANQAHEWTEYERQPYDAMAYFERGQTAAGIIAIAYAGTLPDAQRPDELTRRNLFKQVTDSARAWENE